MKRKTLLKIACILIPVLFLIADDIYYSFQKYNLEVEIIQKGEPATFSLGELTDFEWDSAYIQRNPNGRAGSIKEEHNLKGNVRRLMTNVVVRIIFVKDRRIVRSSKLSKEIMLDPSIEVLKPDTLLHAKKISNYNTVLYLSLEE